MRLKFASILLVTLSSAAPSASEAPSVLVEQAQELAGRFVNTLLPTLQQAMPCVRPSPSITRMTWRPATPPVRSAVPSV